MAADGVWPCSQTAGLHLATCIVTAYPQINTADASKIASLAALSYCNNSSTQSNCNTTPHQTGCLPLTASQRRRACLVESLIPQEPPGEEAAAGDGRQELLRRALDCAPSHSHLGGAVEVANSPHHVAQRCPGRLSSACMQIACRRAGAATCSGLLGACKAAVRKGEGAAACQMESSLRVDDYQHGNLLHALGCRSACSSRGSGQVLLHLCCICLRSR